MFTSISSFYSRQDGDPWTTTFPLKPVPSLGIIFIVNILVEGRVPT